MSLIELPDELHRVIAGGLADVEAGRYVTIATKEDERRVLDGIMARLRARVSIDDRLA